MSNDKVYDAGMAVRRQILGDAHVDRAVEISSPLNREFQDLIVRYGWGEIWTRPVLDHRDRTLLVIGTMLGIGRWEEFDMHVRAALRRGFPLVEIKEVIIQQSCYCGVPAANTAFHRVQTVIDGLKGEGIEINGDGSGPGPQVD
jgi:4-carboxymuconolactone decarboxylase